MKIRAIRLKEVGRFSTPVALEGLTGELDVLAGPNELGKSTILRAVRSVLFEQHRSKHRKLEVLRPYAGGAPLIEVDFEVGGKSWRIRKQFLSSPAAELRDLKSGSVARGADAEAQLGMLLGGSEHFSLLCVEQGAPLSAMAPTQTGGDALMAVIESEVESVAEGNTARIVSARVRDELALLVTSHNPPRPTGALKAAIEEREALAAQKADAERRLAAAQQRLDQLEELRERLSALTAPDAAELRDKAAADARRVYDEAREARGKLETTAKAIASCERERDALEAVLRAFDKSVEEQAVLEAAARSGAQVLNDCVLEAKERAAAAAASRKARDAMKSALTALERERRALELSERVQRLAERLETARAADAARGMAMAAVAGNGAEGKIVEGARKEAAAIAALSARLSAAAPSLSLAYAPGGAGKIKVGGRPLKDGETLSPTRPLTLHIEGVGTLTVAPGQSDDVARDDAKLDAHRRQLASLLAQAKATSLEEAEAQLGERRSHEGRLAEAVASLKAAAPEGLEKLQRAHAELAAQLATAGADVTASEEALEARAQELMEALGEAEEKLKSSEGDERAALDALADARAQAAENGKRIAALTAELGPAAERAAMREARFAALEAARAALNAAVRESDAWRERAPDDVRLAALRSAAEATARASSDAQSEIMRLRRLEAGIEGELKSDRADDVAARVAELGDLCANAIARCGELQEEAAALQLLARELDGAAARTRERFARPVIGRLEPYLQMVMPQARLVLGETLAPQALQRGGGSEDIARLSDGTQEQLALLVRLAFARLLADNDTPAPLILDDALVYADDERMGRVFAALRHAAQRHQVLVLTCRERAFAELGGNRVALRTWEDARAAA